MGRGEHEPTQANDLRVEFAQALRRLRRSAGSPSYRELAQEVDHSASDLARAASGMRLPSWEVVSAFVTACDGDPADWQTQYHDVVIALASRDDLDADERQRVFAHIADCPDCRDHAAAQKTILALLRQIESPQVPEELLAKLHAVNARPFPSHRTADSAFLDGFLSAFGIGWMFRPKRRNIATYLDRYETALSEAYTQLGPP